MLGRSLFKYLSALGEEVYGLERPKVLGSGDEFSENIFYAGSESWPSVIKSFNFELIILCDWSGVNGADRENFEIQSSNVDRWRNNVTAAIEGGVKSVIALGSQAEISSSQDGVGPISTFNPRNSYGKAKYQAFREISALCVLNNRNFTWGRVFSVFGDRSPNNWLIPSFLDAATNHKVLQLTPCNQIWNFLHVQDFSSAIYELIRTGESHGVFNIGHPTSYQLRPLLEEVAQQFKIKHLFNFGAIPYPKDQVMIMRPNVSELLKLGWHPEFDIKEYLIDKLSQLDQNELKSTGLKG